MADAFEPLPGVDRRMLMEASLLASLSDETPEGKSIVALAEKQGLRASSEIAEFIPFSASTRISGANLGDGTMVRKGAEDAVLAWCDDGESGPLKRIIETIARSGGTPLVVARDRKPLGVIHLKDIVKPGIRERFAELRRMGIRTVMITGDNPLTAAAIAAEAGVDDFLAQATPEKKLDLIRGEQAGGRLVAMCGDGTNDAPALADGLPASSRPKPTRQFMRNTTARESRLASTANPSSPTSPSATQRRTTVSNTFRSKSLSRKRPCRFLEKLEWCGTSPSRPSRQNQR